MRAAEMTKIGHDFRKDSRQVFDESLERPAAPGGVRRIQTLRAFRQAQLDDWMMG